MHQEQKSTDQVRSPGQYWRFSPDFFRAVSVAKSVFSETERINFDAVRCSDQDLNQVQNLWDCETLPSCPGRCNIANEAAAIACVPYTPRPSGLGLLFLIPASWNSLRRFKQAKQKKYFLWSFAERHSLFVKCFHWHIACHQLCNNITSSEEVGVHQGSVLSPLLFIIVMEALSRRFDDRGLPWELLYADDLVLLADSEDDLRRKLQRWKNGLEAKGLRVNVGKTKVMRCGVGLQKVVDSRKYPCGVCDKGVDANSIPYAWSGYTSAVVASAGNWEQKTQRNSNARHVSRELRVQTNQRLGVLNWMMDRNLNSLINSAILVIC